MERVTQLETSSQQWKGRVTQTDATRFTVAHKMASATSVPSLTVPSTASESHRASCEGTSQAGLLASPAAERRKRSPLPKVFKSKTGACLPDLLSKAAAEDLSKPFVRSISIPSGQTEAGDQTGKSGRAFKGWKEGRRVLVLGRV